VENFMSNDSIICDESARNKNTLVGANNTRKDGLDFVYYGFGIDFEGYTT
jgi:hypothetical protein